MKKLIEEINEMFAIELDKPENIQMMIMVESLAICFQALIDTLDELKESIDPDPRNPVYR